MMADAVQAARYLGRGGGRNYTPPSLKCVTIAIALQGVQRSCSAVVAGPANAAHHVRDCHFIRFLQALGATRKC